MTKIKHAPNITAGCRLMVIDETDPFRPVWKTIARDVIDTPKGVADAMRAHALSSCWVDGVLGRRLVFAP